MIRFSLICVGKLKEEYTRAAADDYVKRLSKYGKVTVTEVPESDIAGEGEALLRKLPHGHDVFVTALDLHGRMIDSVELAEMIKRETVGGVSDFVFVIGGSDGISGQVTNAADFRLCLSPMTFTHQMTRVIILEQIYRAMKIINGEKYHK